MCRSKHAKHRYIENKEHINEINARWKAENSDKHREINRLWRKNNHEKHKQSGKDWYCKNKEQRRNTIHQWYVVNSEKVIEKNKKWKIAHPEAARKMRLRADRKIRSTPWGKLNCSMSSGIGFSLRGNKAGRHWETLVGYTVWELKKHLESKFIDGITWDNYGKVWEIDHIIPKSFFHYSSAEDPLFKIAWGLSNLQPLWKTINRRKSKKLDYPYAEMMNG